MVVNVGQGCIPACHLKCHRSICRLPPRDCLSPEMPSEQLQLSSISGEDRSPALHLPPVAPAMIDAMPTPSSMVPSLRRDDDVQRDDVQRDDVQRDDVQRDDVHPNPRPSDSDCAERGQARMNPRPTQDHRFGAASSAVGRDHQFGAFNVGASPYGLGFASLRLMRSSSALTFVNWSLRLTISAARAFDTESGTGAGGGTTTAAAAARAELSSLSSRTESARHWTLSAESCC
jgi:hypothetical protein